VRLDPKEEPGNFPAKRAVGWAHPRRLVNLFGEVHNPRLKPKGLVETVGGLAEVMVHGRLLTITGGFFVMGHVHQLNHRATLQESCALATMPDELVKDS